MSNAEVTGIAADGESKAFTARADESDFMHVFEFL